MLFVAGGRLSGQIVRLIVRKMGLMRAGENLQVSLTSYAVIGAAAYMGGATRMTLTTTVMVMETTGALQLIVPIIITVFVAKVGACQLILIYLHPYKVGCQQEFIDARLHSAVFLCLQSAYFTVAASKAALAHMLQGAALWRDLKGH